MCRRHRAAAVSLGLLSLDDVAATVDRRGRLGPVAGRPADLVVVAVDRNLRRQTEYVGGIARTDDADRIAGAVDLDAVVAADEARVLEFGAEMHDILAFLGDGDLPALIGRSGLVFGGRHGERQYAENEQQAGAQ